MKKFIALIVLVLILFWAGNILTKYFKYYDDCHAILTATDSNGEEYTIESVNASRLWFTVSPRLYSFDHGLIIKGEEGDVFKVLYFCPECKKKIEIEMTCPSQRIFHCDCSHLTSKQPYEEFAFLSIVENS